MEASKVFGVYEKRGRRTQIFTANLTPCQKAYDEKLVNENGREFREWNPFKSKLGAYIMHGANDIFLRQGSIVLYLGIASGTTASHISDIIGNGGMIFGIDPAFRAMTKLMFLCTKRKNIAPIMDDANHPENYEKNTPEKVDFIFQDVAQKNQAEIFLKNTRKYLKPGGFGMIAVKARSIDIAANPRDIFRKVRTELEKELTIVDFRPLEPYEKDHAMIVVKKK
jgi:fibrillarin-like pre-rRNA processing protein